MITRALAAIAFVLAVGSTLAQSPDLAAPTRLTGRVLDAAGNPLADAAVGVVGLDWHDAQVAAQPSARTGADGRFAAVVTQWPRIPRQIVVVAAGHATAEWALSSSYDEQLAMLGQPHVDLGELVLREGVVLRGGAHGARSAARRCRGGSRRAGRAVGTVDCHMGQAPGIARPHRCAR